jgi:hypothetical protein
MSSTSKDIKQNGLDVVIDPTATNDTLPTMPSCDSGRGYNSIENLKEFVIILSVFNPCFRNYYDRTRKLELIYYDRFHNGCKVTIDLKSSTITIKVFIHDKTLEEAKHTFHSSGFQECVIPFLTPAELEQQKRFDDFQVEEQRLMAEQQKLRKQEDERQDEALKKAHMSVPKTCGGVDNCKFCKHNKAHVLLGMGWKSNFTFTGT